MGQYYNSVVIDTMGRVFAMNPHTYDNGWKLMEHSYYKNNYVNAILGLLRENPCSVGWIGDYSMDFDGSAYEDKLPKNVFRMIVNQCWNNDNDIEYATPEPLEKTDGLFLVNHRQKCYIDLDKFYEKNKWDYKWNDYLTGEQKSETWCVHPLPLLTACGNGRGGGDYHSCYPDYDKVGTWAFDTLELMEEIPDGYEEVMYEFTEQRKV